MTYQIDLDLVLVISAIMLLVFVVVEICNRMIRKLEEYERNRLNRKESSELGRLIDNKNSN